MTKLRGAACLMQHCMHCIPHCTSNSRVQAVGIDALCAEVTLPPNALAKTYIWSIWCWGGKLVGNLFLTPHPILCVPAPPAAWILLCRRHTHTGFHQSDRPQLGRKKVKTAHFRPRDQLW